MVIANKLGQEELSLMAWIPILNLYCIVKLADFNGLTALIFFIPIVNYFYLVFCLMRISAFLNRNPLLGLLMFLPVVNFILLGYLTFTDKELPNSLI